MLLQLKKAQAEAADATTQLSAVEQALKTLEAGDMDAIKHQYVNAVRKMAVAQVKSLAFVATFCKGHCLPCALAHSAVQLCGASLQIMRHCLQIQSECCLCCPYHMVAC